MTNRKSTESRKNPLRKKLVLAKTTLVNITGGRPPGSDTRTCRDICTY